MKVSILDRRYIYIVGCFGPLITPVELSAKEIKQLQQLGYKLELYVPNKPAVVDPSIRIELNIKETNINKGETVKLVINENGKPFEGKVNYSVNENGIVNVTNEGVVTGLKEGIAIVSTVHKGVSLMSVITVLKGQEEVQPVAEVKVEEEVQPIAEEVVEEVKTEEVVEEKVQPIAEEVVEEVKTEEVKVEEEVQPIAEEVVEEEVKEQPKKTTKKTTTKKK